MNFNTGEGVSGHTDRYIAELVSKNVDFAQIFLLNALHMSYNKYRYFTETGRK